MGNGIHKISKNDLPVGQLMSESALVTYGYLSLSSAIMQIAGSAVQTVAAIRSHWGTATWADPRTIAKVACLDESTVRRRHLPKLQSLKFVGVRHVNSQRGERCEFYLTTQLLAAGFFTRERTTLPRWAALMLRQWSHRAVYAFVFHGVRKLTKGLAKGPIEIDMADAACGNYGNSEYSLSKIANATGLSREVVADAKAYLLNCEWLVSDGMSHRGETLLVNVDKVIPATTLIAAHKTTRSEMFKKRKPTEVTKQ